MKSTDTTKNTTNHAPYNPLLTRAVQEVIELRSLTNKLERRRPLRVKLGVDPTGYHLHLGHVVPLRKLRAFQEAGHQAVLVIGDYTAQVGDPSGKDKTRSALKAEQVEKFAAGYLDQVGLILDMAKTEVRHNSEWFGKFTAAEFLQLLSRMTVNQLLAHETFRRRIDQGLPLGLHELAYPLLQGYDSVAVQADVELGGVDQKFNLLAGREMQVAHNQPPQDVMLVHYLMGTDGQKKMGKTEDNYIALDDSAEAMFGKTMSIPDTLIGHYFELATDVATDEIQAIEKSLKTKTTNPRDVKVRLAKAIVSLYHGQAVAEQAATEFSHVFQKKGLPSALPTATVKPGPHSLLNLLVSQRLASSRSEARRLITQGGVKVDRQPITDWESTVTVSDGMIIQVGKRKFLKLEVKS